MAFENTCTLLTTEKNSSVIGDSLADPCNTVISDGVNWKFLINAFATSSKHNLYRKVDIVDVENEAADGFLDDCSNDSEITNKISSARKSSFRRDLEFNRYQYRDNSVW
ncbi:hypothetical protein PUN28_016875 [Cardiocondyla obscurior]|uniref:Uncharacterized protein n=1 Tax=Cardiocondyla obscurior TaxID=286306 RepID=A0AAW2EP76_9HYME